MLDKVERTIARHCLISGFALAQGAEIEMPDSDDLLSEWIEALSAPPESFDNPEKHELMKALGLVK